VREARAQYALLLFHAGHHEDAWVELGALAETEVRCSSIQSKRFPLAAWAKALVGESRGVKSVSPVRGAAVLTAERRRRRGAAALAGGARATGDGFAAVASERRLERFS